MAQWLSASAMGLLWAAPAAAREVDPASNPIAAEAVDTPWSEVDGETIGSYEVGVNASVGRGFTLPLADLYRTFKNLQSLVLSGDDFVVHREPDRSVSSSDRVRPARPDRQLRRFRQAAARLRRDRAFGF